MYTTTWTITRFVRWRVSDWASCFLPLDDHEPASSSSPRMVVDKRNDNRLNHVYDNKFSRRPSKKRETKNRREQDKDEASVGNTVDDSSCSPFADEDYIVFCFREDGAFDVIKDGKCVKSEPSRGGVAVDGSSRNSRPVNRKLNYGEDKEQVSKQSMHEGGPNDEEMSRQQKRENKSEVEDRAVVSSGSRDSNQSEGSTGSFAFPV